MMEIIFIIKYIDNDGDNFYNLIISIMDNIADLNDNIIDNIKSIFINNNIIKSEQESENKSDLSEQANEDNNESEEEEDDDNPIDDTSIKNDDINNKEVGNKDYVYLLNGDVLIEEKVKPKN